MDTSSPDLTAQHLPGDLSVPGPVVLAPDKFKGSLSAVQVAERLAAGLRRAAPQTELRLLPVADGGDGTVEAAVAAGYRRVDTQVTGPCGDPVPASFAVLDSARTAVVELAEASGLSRLPHGTLAPMTASSRGTGELVQHALDTGCHTLVLGLGGSACTDGGAGLSQALGARLKAADGTELPPGGGALAQLDHIDPAGLPHRLADVDVLIASDVDNPLLGEHSAAAVYGPQKGASDAQVAELDAALARLADVAARDVPGATGLDTRPGAGAAGGVGFGALAFLGARLEPGIALLLRLLGFDTVAHGASLVITGEGRLDEQTLRGKAPAGVAAAARRAGARVAAVAGVCDLSAGQLVDSGFVAAYPLSALEPDAERSMRQAGALLEEVGSRIAVDLLRSPSHPQD